jgi:hypothetical protein
MSFVKTDCREVIDCLTKYNVTYVLVVNILILFDSLWTHKPLLCPLVNAAFALYSFCVCMIILKVYRIVPGEV